MKKIYCTVLLCLVFLFSIGSIQGTANSKPVSYQSVVVQPGDSVWKIASRYDTSGSVKEYVKEIMKFNQMSSPKLLPGQRLILPIFHSEN